MFYRATGENERGCAPLGVGQAQAARLCRTVGDHGIVRVFRERKKLLTSGGIAPCPAQTTPGARPPSNSSRARSRRKSTTEGLSSISFSRIASALRCSASASVGLPVLDSRLPRLLWLSASRLRNSVTAGFSAASF